MDENNKGVVLPVKASYWWHDDAVNVATIRARLSGIRQRVYSLNGRWWVSAR